MSKFEEQLPRIVETLHRTPDAVLAGAKDYIDGEYTPDKHPYNTFGWTHWVDLYVFPAEPIYKADELNDFMENLPLDSSTHGWGGRRFLEQETSFGSNRGKTILHLGRLELREQIGTGTLTMQIQMGAGALAVRAGLFEPEWTKTQQVQVEQRVTIKIFPDEGHLADAVLDKRNIDEIPVDELGQSLTGRDLSAVLVSPTTQPLIHALGAQTQLFD